MLDVKLIRQNPDKIKQGLKQKNDNFDLEAFLKLDHKRRGINAEIEKGYSQQNKINQEVQVLLKEKKDYLHKVEEGRRIKEEIDALEVKASELNSEFEKQILEIPNIPHLSVPIGNATHNKVINTKGKLKEFNFKPLSHIELAENLDIMNFRQAAKLSGSNFVLFKNRGARLVRALINFMLDLHTKKHGYTEVFPSFLVNRTSMTTTGQLPKFEEDMYRLKDDDYFLIPTAEVPVTNIHRDEIINENDLPICYAAYTACFRREAGSYGKDTKGLVRVHQFDKVELVKFVKPDSSYAELESLLKDACRVIDLLKIPYRVVLLASGDLSFASSKCYDIEIYAPGIDKWLEVSSCSNFEDFQARRGNIKYREKQTKKLKFVHTLNGSGVALARLIVSLLENHQNKDGSVAIPEALQPYFDGKKQIS